MQMYNCSRAAFLHVEDVIHPPSIRLHLTFCVISACIFICRFVVRFFRRVPRIRRDTFFFEVSEMALNFLASFSVLFVQGRAGQFSPFIGCSRS